LLIFGVVDVLGIIYGKDHFHCFSFPFSYKTSSYYCSVNFFLLVLGFSCSTFYSFSS